ncbi:MAG: Zn-ribbon domain-containing protein [Nanoarchaeota archaeon]|nr:Zn-ribbon domain-containing protein [Nanoarchaeota archaeon]MBU1135557.1 Zn-ribbon domain-containing protein [Nanoarchaeota archaeon]MBU2520378.1 Zn-ribbon domain-containing protein [Nanoarchaeota archaeon]
MPNKCTRCGKVHPDNADYLVTGCDECGSKFFFFMRQEAIEKYEKEAEKLTKQEVKEIENDIREILPEKINKDDTVILDVEAIRIIKPGKYRIDVTNLFSQKPIVIRVGPGKYELDLSTIMKEREEDLENGKQA